MCEVYKVFLYITLFKDEVNDSLFVILKSFNCTFYVRSMQRVSLYYLFKDRDKDSLFSMCGFVLIK